MNKLKARIINPSHAQEIREKISHLSFPPTHIFITTSLKLFLYLLNLYFIIMPDAILINVS